VRRADYFSDIGLFISLCFHPPAPANTEKIQHEQSATRRLAKTRQDCHSHEYHVSGDGRNICINIRATLAVSRVVAFFLLVYNSETAQPLCVAGASDIYAEYHHP
jgi:hypothetical protein